MTFVIPRNGFIFAAKKFIYTSFLFIFILFLLFGVVVARVIFILFVGWVGRSVGCLLIFLTNQAHTKLHKATDKRSFFFTSIRLMKRSPLDYATNIYFAKGRFEGKEKYRHLHHHHHKQHEKQHLPIRLSLKQIKISVSFGIFFFFLSFSSFRFLHSFISFSSLCRVYSHCFCVGQCLSLSHTLSVSCAHILFVAAFPPQIYPSKTRK